MSQKKVDIYKEQKKNRKSIIKKEKRMLMLEKLIGLVVCLAVVVWLGFSIHGKMTANQPVEVKETTINTEALTDYVNGIQTVEDVETADAE
ncbi:MAG: hypothetical protein Q4B47_01835 [Eubacteriales bacterium]|nr:hypothetical protein [Eubacteriales bacterium]